MFVILVFSTFLGYAGVGSADPAIAKRVEEYQIKALFLYNFANFVNWPAKAFENDRFLKLCLVGHVPFGGFLDKVNGTFIGERELRIIRTEREDKNILSGCHILFVGLDQQNELEKFFKNLNHTFVLSVGNEPRFADDWGTVNIKRVRDGAEVEINLKRAIESGLFISSDLLAISRVIQ